MKKTIPAILIFAFGFSLMGQTETLQISEPSTWPGDQISIGLGMGLDHGGFGGNVSFYPVRNVGLFGGLGYALAGVGYNAGVKVRYIPEKYAAKVHPFVNAMYGYNAAIVVLNRTDLNKIFYGPSLGVGLDFHRSHLKKGYWSFSILVPIRNAEVNEYIEMLETVYGAEFPVGLFPIAVSIGYRFIITQRL